MVVLRSIAWVLVTVAIYLALFGAGSEIWAISALGIGLLLLAVILAVIAVVRGRAPVWIAGMAHVVGASEAPASTHGRCELQLVVETPGLAPVAVKVRDPWVAVAKWPVPGATLPILVAVDDPRHLRIKWDEVPPHAEAAALDEDLSGDVLGGEDGDLGPGTWRAAR